MTRALRNRWLGYGALAAGAYLCALLALLPARVAWGCIEPRLDLPLTLQAGAMSGTAWKGRANDVRVNGRSLGDLEWRWRPSDLLGARLGFQLAWSGASSERLDLALGVRPGSLIVRDFRGTFEAARVQRLFDLPLLLDGTVDVDVDRLRYSDASGFGSLQGTLAWRDAAGGLPRPMALGHYRLELEDDDGRVIASVDSAPGAPLDALGYVDWHPLTGYRLELELRAGEGAAPALIGALDTLGPRQPNGAYRLRRAGAP
jgi:general secretion pathway protein N